MVDVRKGIGWLREAVFPTHCVSCSAWGEWWCAECRGKLEPIRFDACPDCGFVGDDHDCSQSIEGLDAIIVTGFYHDPILRSLITSLKYKGATCLLPSLELHLAAWSRLRLMPWPWAGEPSFAIQPVPASPSRVRMRGFDQASLIADAVQRTIAPWADRSDALSRSGSSMPQASLEHGPLRRANIAGAFRAKPAMIPATVLLVDDVLTTGATMSEAARALRQAGTERVFGFAVAVGK